MGVDCCIVVVKGGGEVSQVERGDLRVVTYWQIMLLVHSKLEKM